MISTLGISIRHFGKRKKASYTYTEEGATGGQRITWGARHLGVASEAGGLGVTVANCHSPTSYSVWVLIIVLPDNLKHRAQITF